MKEVALLQDGTRRRRVPSIVFTKGGGLWLEEIAGVGCDAVGLDWTVNLGCARKRTDDRCALQGNLDPMALFAPEAALRAQVRRVIDDFGVALRPDGRLGGHVFNLGHGILPETPVENVKACVDEVKLQPKARG